MMRTCGRFLAALARTLEGFAWRSLLCRHILHIHRGLFARLCFVEANLVSETCRTDLSRASRQLLGAMVWLN